METELVASHVEAIRIFGIDRKNLLLCSLAKTHNNWLPGEDQRSVCDHATQHGHLKPARNCTCGIWSCFSRSGLIKSYPAFVMGLPPVRLSPWQSGFQHRNTAPGAFFTARIQQWGTIIQHEWGYRSEYARIIPQSIQAWPRIDSASQRKLVKHLREKYGATANPTT